MFPLVHFYGYLLCTVKEPGSICDRDRNSPFKINFRLKLVRHTLGLIWDVTEFYNEMATGKHFQLSLFFVAQEISMKFVCGMPPTFRQAAMAKVSHPELSLFLGTRADEKDSQEKAWESRM